MKKYLLVFLILTLSLPLLSQRLKVKTYFGDSISYKEHYTYILDAATNNGAPTVYIAGIPTDKPSANTAITAHKIVGQSLLANKLGNTTANDNFLLTDFTVQPSVDISYGAGTGVYYPNGPTGNGYPFMGLYNKSTLQIQSFQYFDLSYAGYEPSHATGLRIKYSGEEEAYYICGVMADRPFNEINFNDVTAESKGFILKIPEAGALTYNAIVFSPENVNNEALLCLIGDMEIIHDETKIAFTGMNTIDDFTGHHQPMVGMIDMDLGLDWTKVYEFQSGIFSGVDLVYNDDDTTLFVLQNSQENDFSIMEIDTTGVIVQGPEAWKFTDTSTERDTTRAHTMHYFNDTLLITGNHFADRYTGPSTYVATQYLFSVNVKADTLDKLFDDLTHYSYQDIPVGFQKPIYSFWTPKNSAYLGNDTIYMVGAYNESGNYGFKYVNTGGIHSSCVDILDEEANEVRLYDTTFVEATTETCDATSVSFDHQDANVTPGWECSGEGDSFLAVEKVSGQDELWRLTGISEEGIDALLISGQAARYRVSVYDILGREVYRSEFNVGKGETSINMNFEVKPEVYIIKVSDGAESKTRKVINLNY